MNEIMKSLSLLLLLPLLSSSGPSPTYYGYPSYYSHSPSRYHTPSYPQQPRPRRPYSPSYYSSHSSHSFNFNHGARTPSFPANAHALAQTSAHARRPVIARVDLVPGGDSGVSGALLLKQSGPDAPVMLTGTIQGLSKGPHGFHVHMKGELGNGCKDAGGHFNPFMKSHGNPYSLNRHVGDLGNIRTFSEDYDTEVYILDKLITLEEGAENGIMGRAIVVHAMADDLGQGGDEGSLKTGNAGGRVACGVISRVEY